MHQTTVRFGSDLWEQLEIEARKSGVSAAQYVRDATLARLAHTAARRGEPPFGLAEIAVVEPDQPVEVGAAAALVDARESHTGSAAVWAQARLARERARTLREAVHLSQAAQSQARER
jgi:hypothetical protein